MSSRPLAARFTFQQLSVTLLFIALACAACFMPAQNDTWWHLRAGEDIWRTHGVPLRDTFSHTAFGTYWSDHEWLSQALFFALYRIGGMKLLTAALAAVLTATWILVWRLTPGSHWRRLSIVCLAVISSSIAWSVRPQIFTLLFVALTVTLLRARREWWLPLLFLVWANLHGAVLFGIVLLAATTAGTVLTDRPRARMLMAVTAFCVAMTCVTPLGWSLWTDIPATLARVDLRRVTEWHAPQISDPVFAPFWMLSAAFVALMAAHKIWTTREWLADGAIAGSLAMLPLALGTGRNVPGPDDLDCPGTRNPARRAISGQGDGQDSSRASAPERCVRWRGDGPRHRDCRARPGAATSTDWDGIPCRARRSPRSSRVRNGCTTATTRADS